MISTTTKIKVENILNRIERNEFVSLEERIFLSKLSSISSVISTWVTSALGPDASTIDND